MSKREHTKREPDAALVKDLQELEDSLAEAHSVLWSTIQVYQDNADLTITPFELQYRIRCMLEVVLKRIEWTLERVKAATSRAEGLESDPYRRARFAHEQLERMRRSLTDTYKELPALIATVSHVAKHLEREDEPA